MKLTEKQLQRIIKESIEKVLSEAYTDTQYAHLAGQAHGALNTIGGKVKGIFNPEWRKRKERQVQRFANQATGGIGSSNYNRSTANDQLNNTGHLRTDINPSSNDEIDVIHNRFNQNYRGGNEDAFNLERRHIKKDYNSDNYTPQEGHKDTLKQGDARTLAKSQLGDERYEKSNIRNTNIGNSRLNAAFNQGVNSAKLGKGKSSNVNYINGGDSYTNTTGTKGSLFKNKYA